MSTFRGYAVVRRATNLAVINSAGD